MFDYFASRAARVTAAVAIGTMGLLAAPLNASACGAIISNDPAAIDSGTSATMVGFHNGLEHYLTSFSYSSTPSAVGWLLPVPAMPTVEEGDGSVLDRLTAETDTYRRDRGPFFHGIGSSAPAQVLGETRIRSLGITTLSGTGDGVLQWCADHDFHLDAETTAHIRVYAQATQLFVAAHFAGTPAPGQSVGQSKPLAPVPVMLTMHVDHLWMPLELLAPHGDGSMNVRIYLVTDNRLGDGEHLFGGAKLNDQITGSRNLTVDAQEELPGALRDSLSSLRGMSWLPTTAWLPPLSAPFDRSVDYDLAVGGDDSIRLAAFGTNPVTAAAGKPSARFAPTVDLSEFTPLLVVFVVAVGALAAATLWSRGRRRRPRAG